MKIYYTCERCREPIGCVDVDAVDEEKFGFAALTPEERRDIITIDVSANCMYVQSLCDDCIIALGLNEEGRWSGPRWLVH